MLESKKLIKVLESHSPLSGLIVENMKIETGKKFISLMQCGPQA